MSEKISQRVNALSNAMDRQNLDKLFRSVLTDLTALRATTIGVLTGSATYNPASLADGAGATTTVTVAGAALGDFVLVSNSLDLQGISMTGYVSAADTVSVRFQNESGGTLDLASGTIKAAVIKKDSLTASIGMLCHAETYDTASLADAAGATATFTVRGAALGDSVLVSFGVDLQGLIVTAYVSATDTVKVRIQNETGATVDLASTTVRIRVIPETTFARNQVFSTVTGHLTGTATYDASSLADGAGETTTITVTGAALGDFVLIAGSIDWAAISVTGYVSAADTVSLRFQNESGGTVDLASQTIRARVIPQGGFPSALTLNTIS